MDTKTQVECDNCGCDQLVAYQDGRTLYVECDACGASVATARLEA